MLIDIKKSFEEAMSKSEDDRVIDAKKRVKRIRTYFVSHNISNQKSFMVIISIFKLFVSGDISANEAERIFMARVFDLDISSDEFYELTNYGGSQNFVKGMDTLVDSLPYSIKEDVVFLGLSICAQDGILTPEEEALLIKIAR